MNKDIDKFLNKCVSKSLGAKKEDKYSILPCLENEYLHPDFDPFQMLEFELMALKARRMLLDNPRD